MRTFTTTFRFSLLMLLLKDTVVQAQVNINAAALTYEQYFNTLDTGNTNSSALPPGWEIFEYGTSASVVNNQYKGSSGSSTTGDVYSYGSSGSHDRALGSIGTSGNKECYGVMFKNGTGTTITAVHITYRGEQWRRGACTSDTLLFRYSTTASGIADTMASTWTPYLPLSLTGINAGAPNNTATDGNAVGNHIIVSDTLPLNLAPGDSLLLEWVDKDATGSDNGLAIDDVAMVFLTYGPPVPQHIYITGKWPQGTGVDPATNQVTITFDHLIEQDSGQIILQPQGGAPALSITVPSAQVSIADSTATLSGLLLDNNKAYYILLSEGTFRKYADTIPSIAITDMAYWTFSTADTVIPRPLTSLSESFRLCSDTAMGIFRPYNVSGFKTWRCAATGHNGDSASVSMSGGVTDSISDSNTDWLISTSAFDFSAMAKPELSLWQKMRFSGTVSRTVRISTDYISGHHPGTATWTILPVQDMVDAPAMEWMPVSDIDLSPYKNTPFFLAFTYSCGEHGAYELSYDDIEVQDETLGIAALTPESYFDLRIIGEASAGYIQLSIAAKKALPVTVDIFDRNGKLLFKKVLQVHEGTGFYALKDTGLLPGLYVIRAYNAGYCDTEKVLIR